MAIYTGLFNIVALYELTIVNENLLLLSVIVNKIIMYYLTPIFN